MIRYTGSNDPSGYGEAFRNDVQALYLAGANITTEVIKQMGEDTNYGLAGDIVNRLKDRNIDYKYKIIHLTPDLYPNYIEDDKYNIGRLFWETDRLPKEWIEPCNMMQEIWTASEPMVEMIKNSGVTVPVFAIPQPIETRSEIIRPLKLSEPKDFTFYSIFQWIMRKNPRTLLRAYWKEFTGDDKVTLLLKTYRVTYQESEFDIIKNEIAIWKNQLKLKHFPKIYLIERLLTDSQIEQLHVLSDCFIQPSSGEGWSRPTAEAILRGKPVISGDNGGITDYLTPYHYYKVESKSVPVAMQSHIPWYEPPQQWKDLDEDSLREQMRAVYNDYHKAQATAKRAQDFLIDNMSLDKVGKIMLNRLYENSL